MNNRTMISALILSASFLFASSASAESLSADDALQKAFKHNRELRAAAIDLKRADLLVVSADGERVPLWTTDVGYRYGRTPRLSSTGRQLTLTDALVVGTELSYTFSPGTKVATWAEVGRSVRDTVELGDLGAAYDMSFGFEVAQPWLRGFGSDIVDAQIEQARASKKAASASQIATANGVAQSVLTAYWSLWSAQKSLQIAEEALEVTQKELQQGEARLDEGIIAPAELVSLRTEVASAKETVVAAKTRVGQASLTLANAIGLEATTELRASDIKPPNTELAPLQDSISLAKEQSPDLIRLRANVRSARIEADVAENNALPNLETTASLQFAGIGNEIGSSIEDLAQLDAVTGYVGIRLELPLFNDKRRADADRADLAAQNARLEVERYELELASQMSKLWSDALSARERLDLAKETAKLARENVEAQSARFEVGKSTTLDVTDAIQRLREAENRVLQVEVELVEAQLGIAELTGTLFQG